MARVTRYAISPFGKNRIAFSLREHFQRNRWPGYRWRRHLLTWLHGWSTIYPMRIIAGELKGRRFDTPEGRETRPLLSRLRKALFDTLGPQLQGARFLDLFGGSGAFSYEALSRGAAHAVVVESSPKALSLIRKNARHLGIEDRLECLGQDVRSALPALHAKGVTFDIIGIAPPYFEKLQDETLDILQDHPVYNDESLIFIQCHKKESIKTTWNNFNHLKTRKYGSNTLVYFKRSPTLR
ncbi:16S rRNA (guanine(966)-N(2))-methyltransferase RsmD [Acidobacteriota bacterium]